MMYVTSCLLAVAFLGAASAQTFSMGNCNPKMETTNNFDKDRFAGVWYKIKRAYNVHDVGKKCHIATFNLSEKSIYFVDETSVSTCNDSEKQAVSFSANDDDVSTGKVMMVPGFIKAEQPFRILDTDYDNYMILYSCLDSYLGKLEFVYIEGREPTLDNALVAKAEKVLKDKEIKVKLMSEIQDCV